MLCKSSCYWVMRIVLLTICVLLFGFVPSVSANPPAQGSQITLTADRTSLTPPQCATLRYSIPAGWSYVEILGFPWMVSGVGAGRGGGAMQNSEKVCPTATTTYTVWGNYATGRKQASVTITVSAPPPQPKPQPPQPAPSAQISFSVDRNTITQGQCANLRWDVEYVRAVFLDGQGVEGHETRQVCPSSSRTYTLRVVTNSGEQNRSVTVNVIASSAPPSVPQQPPQQPQPRPSGRATITVNKTKIQLGEEYQVCFSISGPGYIEIFVTLEDGTSWPAIGGDDDGSGGCIPGIASEPVGRRQLNLILVSNDIVIATAETSFEVLPKPAPPPPSLEFRSDRTTIQRGECVTLNWSAANVQNLILDGSSVSSNSGSKQDCPPLTKTYTLSATSNSGDINRTVTINVQVPLKPADVVVDDCTLSDSLTNFSVMQQPTVFKPNVLWLKITNKGETRFEPPAEGGKYTIQVILKKLGVGKLEEYQFVATRPPSLVPFSSLNPRDSQTPNVFISDLFFFTPVENAELEIFLQPNSSLNLRNSVMSKSITVKPHPDNAWGCAAMLAKVVILGVNGMFPATIAVDPAAQAFLNYPKMILQWQACGSSVSCGATATAQYLLSVIGSVPAKLINAAVDITKIYKDALDPNKAPLCSSWVDFMNAVVREWIRNNIRINVISVQSPANILVVNHLGQQVGFADDGTMLEEIPDARAIKIGEAKMIFIPEEGPINIRVKGTDTGTIKLNLEMDAQNNKPVSAAYLDVPVTSSTVGKIEISDSRLALRLDDNNDGTVDRIAYPADSGGTSRIEIPTIQPPTVVAPTQIPKSQNIGDNTTTLISLAAILVLVAGVIAVILRRRRR